MRLLLALITILLLATSMSGQTNDCAKATTICVDSPPTGNPMGIGKYDDFSNPDNDPGCLSSEGNTAWFYLEIEAAAPSGLTLEFSIIPDGGYGEDYDWALFGPDVDCGNLGSPIRCSSASFNCAFCPETGLGMGAIDLTEGPGGEGDGFVAPLIVGGGEGYYIAINNWYGTGNGFTMTFGGDAAQYMDCTADPPCSVTAVASDDVTICEGGVPAQIHVTPSGGLPGYSFSWIGTGTGSEYLNDPTSPDPIVSIPLGASGSYTYQVIVTDGICEASDSVVVTITPHSPLQIDFLIGLDLDGQPTILNPKVSQGKPPYTFLWNDGSTDPSRSGLTPGIYQLTVTDGKGCTRAQEFKYGLPVGGLIGNGGLQIEQVPGTAQVRFDRIPGGQEPWRVLIVDVYGRVLQSHTLSSDITALTCTIPFPGMFWIQAIRPDGYQQIRAVRIL